MTESKAVKGLKAEAEDSTTLEFEYDGDKYVVEKEMLTDIDVIELMEDDKMVKPIKLILGGEQWATFRKNHKSGKQLAELAVKMWEGIGVDLGE